ncbi:sigma-70 family RNA polymerase sigma factor [Streptomyces boncukensis]|uniref:sigma-70 family RNA polymerase sigma factor n=1 Tax=Streptomyces boncukensis TaxID=2711219 RepID=UPI001F49EBDF|nr:sigma-70 family RNA polymerase sigma factor [Streptomyces boncukensis]
MEEHTLPGPRLTALLDAECAAEAAACPGTDPADLRQGVLLRWLQHTRTTGAPPAPPGDWLRAAVRAEAARQRPYPVPGRAPVQRPPSRVTAADGLADPVSDAEAPLLAAECRRALAAAASGLPGRCPAVLRALLARSDPTYPQIARELGMSQGSLGPLRSRCLARLRRMLAAEVAAPRLRGRVREATGGTGADSSGTAPSPSRARADTTWGGMRTWV